VKAIWLAAAMVLGWGGFTANAEDRLHCVEQGPSETLTAKSRPLVPGKTIWLKPGGAFWFKVDCVEQLPRQYRLKLEFYDGDQPAANAEVLLARERPLTLQSMNRSWRLWVE